MKGTSGLFLFHHRMFQTRKLRLGEGKWSRVQEGAEPDLEPWSTTADPHAHRSRPGLWPVPIPCLRIPTFASSWMLIGSLSVLMNTLLVLSSDNGCFMPEWHMDPAICLQGAPLSQGNLQPRLTSEGYQGLAPCLVSWRWFLRSTPARVPQRIGWRPRVWSQHLSLTDAFPESNPWGTTCMWLSVSEPASQKIWSKRSPHPLLILWTSDGQVILFYLLWDRDLCCSQFQR